MAAVPISFWALPFAVLPCVRGRASQRSWSKTKHAGRHSRHHCRSTDRGTFGAKCRYNRRKRPSGWKPGCAFGYTFYIGPARRFACRNGPVCANWRQQRPDCTSRASGPDDLISLLSEELTSRPHCCLPRPRKLRACQMSYLRRHLRP